MMLIYDHNMKYLSSLWLNYLGNPALRVNGTRTCSIVTGKLNFRFKSQPTQLIILKLSSEHSCGAPDFFNRSLRQIGQWGF